MTPSDVFTTADRINDTSLRAYPDDIERCAAEVGDYAIYDDAAECIDDAYPYTSVTVGDVEDTCYRVPLAPLMPDLYQADDRYWMPDRGLAIRELDDLTDEEKFIVKTSIMRSKSPHVESQVYYSVNLLSVLMAYRRPKCNQNKSKHACYMSLYRAAFRLENRGVAAVKKEDDGLIWIYIPRKILETLAAETRRKMEAHRKQHIDLMGSLCEIPTTDSELGKRAKRDVYAIPKNATNERLSAVKLTMGVAGMMNNVDRADISRLFMTYNDRVTEKIIALLDNKTGELIGSEYSTRFNDTRKAAIALNKFDWAVAESLKDYWKASLLTLTTDPKRYPSLWHANRAVGRAWNKFMQWLTKRCNGTRPEYIAAYEYTKSGLIHIHAIMLMSWVADKKDITAEWEKIGHGTVNDVRGLVRTKAKDGSYVWKWAVKRPYGSTAASGGDYLKKYLKKATLASFDKYNDPGHIQSLYWVFNKRFWSCSRRLLPPPELFVKAAEETKEEKKEENGYSFYRILDEIEAYEMDVRIIYHRGGSGKMNDPPDAEATS